VNGWSMALPAFAGAAFFKASALAILVLAACWSLAGSYYRREHQ
jgi:hypothetical protein